MGSVASEERRAETHTSVPWPALPFWGIAWRVALSTGACLLVLTAIFVAVSISPATPWLQDALVNAVLMPTLQVAQETLIVFVGAALMAGALRRLNPWWQATIAAFVLTSAVGVILSSVNLILALASDGSLGYSFAAHLGVIGDSFLYGNGPRYFIGTFAGWLIAYWLHQRKK